MLELALTLQLLGAAPEATAAHLRLVPTLSLSQEAGAPAAAPDLSPGPQGPGPRPFPVGQLLLSSGGIVLADGLVATLLLVTAISAWSDAMSDERSGTTEPLLAITVGTWLLLPPALGVAGARLGGAPPGRGLAAYWLAFLVRLGGSVAAAALADKDRGGLAGATLAATDLVLAPLVIVRVLGGAAPPGPGPVLASPAQLALPAR